MYDLIFCLPGNPSSQIQALNTFFAINDLIGKGKSVAMRHSTANNIYAVRNACLSTEGHKRFQKPFGGTPYENYDRIVWIDSDNIISADQIERLISHDKDIVAGWYIKSHYKNAISCGMYRDDEPVSMTLDDLYECPDDSLISVDYSGMGLMVIKKGVFEKMEYPWFQSWIFDWEEKGEKMARLVMDDECFCLRAKKHGFNIYVDPKVRIQHEKIGII